MRQYRTTDATRIVNEGIAMIEQEFDQKLESGSLGCTRLMSHMYYMILRTRKGEGTNADFNDFIFQNYPRTGEAAKRVCDYMSAQLKQPVAKRRNRISCNPYPAGYLAGYGMTVCS